MKTKASRRGGLFLKTEGAGGLPGSLRNQALRAGTLHLAALLLFFGGLHHLAPATEALAGVAVAVLVLALVHGLLWCHLPENRFPGQINAAPRLGTANHITLLRGLLISLTAGFLFFPLRGSPAAVAWLPGGLYLVAAVLDGVDGAWARKTHTETSLGQALDVRYDALGVLVASAVAVAIHHLPVYYLTAGGAYYIFQLGLWRRRRRGKPVYPVGPRTFARLMAGFQMGFLGAALLPVLSDTVLAMVAPVFLLPLLAGFIWDWLLATGCVDEAAARHGERRMAALMANGPLLLRGVLLISGGRLLFLAPNELFPGSQVIIPGLSLMVAAGFLGRSSSLLMSLLLAYDASVAGVSPWPAVMMIASLMIMLTGTGSLSLWPPEDTFLLRQPGGLKKARRFPWDKGERDAGIIRTVIKPVSGRRAIGQVMALAAVAGLLYWALRDVPLDAVAAAIGRWGRLQWTLFAALNLVILMAMCWRWSFILRRMGHRVGFAALVGYRMGANTLSYITPGPQFGGEPFQAFCLAARHRVPADAAAASVAVDRLMELLGNLFFLALAGIFVLPDLRTKTDALRPVIAGLLGAVLVVGVLLYTIASGGRPLSRLAGKVSFWLRRPRRAAGLVAFLEAGESHAAGILTDRLWGWYALGGFFQWSAFLAEFWLIYAFMGMPLNATGLLTVAVAARLAFLLPLPGGLGALEASQMLAVTSLGVDPVLAVAACGIMRARDLVLISSGGVLAVRWLQPYKNRLSRQPLRPA